VGSSQGTPILITEKYRTPPPLRGRSWRLSDPCRRSHGRPRRPGPTPPFCQTARAGPRNARTRLV